jgi:vitamin B12 transporter
MKTTKYSMVLITLLSIANAQEVALEQIEIVSSNRDEQKLSKTISTTEVITSAMIEQKGYYNLAQALNDIAGLATTQSGGLGQTTSIFTRGMASGSMLVMIDGVRFNDASTTANNAILENISLDNVKQIEIIKGGMSSIWGGNASAGVINIITKTPKNGVHGSLNGSYGTYGTYDVGGDVSYKNDTIGIRAGGSRLATNGISALAPLKSEKDRMGQNNFYGSFDFTPNKHHSFSFSANQTNTDADFDDSYSALLANDAYSYSNGTGKFTSAKYTFSDENYQSTLQATKADGERKYYTTGSFGDNENIYKFSTDNYSWINKYSYTDGTLIGGLEYLGVNGLNQYNTYTPSQDKYIDQGVFMSNLYNLTDTTLLETNLRYDHFSKFDDETSYKVGIKQKIGEFEARANYGKSFDAPSGYQLANTYPASSLNPSTTKGYELGLKYAKILDVVYFSNTVKDEIIYTGSWPTSGYANSYGDTKYNGIEIALNTTLTEQILLSANYTKLFDFNEQIVMANGSIGPKTRRPKETANISLSYEPIEKLTTLVSAQYIGDRFDNDYSTWPASIVSTGNYILWNTSVTYDVTPSISVAMYFKNMFDKDYQSVYGYNSEGRTLTGKLTYKF